MDPDEGIRAITDQLAIIELKQNFTVSDYIAPIRVCTSNDVMNDTTVLRSVGIGEWVKDNPGRGYRLCSFMTQTVFERTQGVSNIFGLNKHSKVFG